MSEPQQNFLDISKFKEQQIIKSDLLVDIHNVKEKSTDNLYLAKISHNEINNDTQAFDPSILHESNILSKISHPSIIKLIGFSPNDFQHNKKHVMITEYCSKGSLKQHQFQEFTDTQKLIILYGIASGMHYLHSNKIIFRNLNTENILLDDKLYPKICGFQLSDQYISSPYLSSIEGQPIYLAPEIWSKGEYSEASDVYAFSMIAYQLLTGQIPFQKLTTNEIYENVKNNKRPNIKSFKIPISYKRLIQICWSQNQNQRPSFEQIVNQLKKNKGFITKNVCLNDFLQYVDFIENSEIEFNADKLIMQVPQKSTNQRITKKLNELFKRDIQILKYFVIAEAKKELIQIDAHYCYFDKLDSNFDLNKLKDDMCKLFLNISKSNQNDNSTIKILENINESIEDEYNEIKKYHIAAISSKILDKIIYILINSIDLEVYNANSKLNLLKITDFFRKIGIMIQNSINHNQNNIILDTREQINKILNENMDELLFDKEKISKMEIYTTEIVETIKSLVSIKNLIDVEIKDQIKNFSHPSLSILYSPVNDSNVKSLSNILKNDCYFVVLYGNPSCTRNVLNSISEEKLINHQMEKTITIYGPCNIVTFSRTVTHSIEKLKQFINKYANIYFIEIPDENQESKIEDWCQFLSFISHITILCSANEPNQEQITKFNKTFITQYSTADLIICSPLTISSSIVLSKPYFSIDINALNDNSLRNTIFNMIMLKKMMFMTPEIVSTYAYNVISKKNKSKLQSNKNNYYKKNMNNYSYQKKRETIKYFHKLVQQFKNEIYLKAKSSENFESFKLYEQLNIFIDKSLQFHLTNIYSEIWPSKYVNDLSVIIKNEINNGYEAEIKKIKTIELLCLLYSLVKSGINQSSYLQAQKLADEISSSKSVVQLKYPKIPSDLNQEGVNNFENNVKNEYTRVIKIIFAKEKLQHEKSLIAQDYNKFFKNNPTASDEEYISFYNEMKSRYCSDEDQNISNYLDDMLKIRPDSNKIKESIEQKIIIDNLKLVFLEEEQNYDEIQKQVKIITNIGNVNVENLNQGVAADSLIFNQEEENEGIERVVSKIQSIDQNKTFKFKNSSDDNHIQDKKLFETEATSFPITSFVNKASHLISLLVSSATDNKNKRKNNNVSYPYSLLSANLLIDCSSNIPEVNKTFNVLLLTAFAFAFNILKIPYEIGVVADNQFRFILKSFEEEHSIQALQRVLDCVLIQRYKTNYPDTFHHAVEHMNCPDETRNQRAIFLFSDGLDENIALVDAWNNQVLNNPSISFGLIATIPQVLDNDNKKLMEDIWTKFSEGTKNSVSTTRLAVIDSNLNNQLNLSKICDCFKDVLSRKLNIQKNYKPQKSLPPKFDYVFSDLTSNEFSSYECNEKTKSDIFVSIDKDIEKEKSNNITLKKLDISCYQNIEQTIASCKVNEEIYYTFKNFINRITDKQKKIFYPQLIKGGMDLNNGVTVVIDASRSCFNFIESIHSIKTVINILCALSSVNIPYVNILLATEKEPIILCNDVSSNEALNENSTIWSALFSYLLQHPLNECNLESGIQAAYDLHRIKGNNKQSYLFVLTDGLYMDERKNQIKEQVMASIQLGMVVVGIGIGMYPLGITDIFQQSVFSPNPNDVIQAILCCFGGQNPNPLEEISPLFPDIEPFENNVAVINKFKEYNQNPVFRELKEKLQKIPASIDAFADVYNEEQDIGNEIQGFINPQGKNTELYIKDFLKTQKILIVQLCDDTICGDAQLNKKYIFENYESGRKECINEAVKFFGISIEVVQNYEDAIKEITKSNNDLCEYYAVWVICGRLPDQLPTRQRNSNKFIGEQFIDVLIQFWKNGGSLVFWADNDPYTFQVNLFLYKVRFENEDKCPSGKVNFQIHGDHLGGQILLGDDTGELKNEKVFNRSPQLFEEVERTKMSHNIGMFNEGKTLSYVENIDVRSDSNYKEKILPFKPFAVDSDGGITILFYPANLKTGTGDIVIDCGFSKLFSDFNLEGTLRYIQNLAGWTCRPEVHMRMDVGTKPCEWRPKAVSHTITNITSPNYSSFINDLILRANENDEISVIARTVKNHGGKINGVLRFSIMWNDLDSWDNNDLDAHCIQPNDFEIYFEESYDYSTTGELDVDITNPDQGIAAVENITWMDKNEMPKGTYKFFVHQYNYRGGDSGFRAEIAFDRQVYKYDYRNILEDGICVQVAEVTLQSDGHFSIRHLLPCI